MAFPEKVLAEDEEVVAHLHPHWITLVPAVLWFLLVCALGGVAIAFLPSGAARRPLLIVAVVVAFALILWLTLKPVITWASSHYVFTTHRVLIRRGVIHHAGRDIALQRISDVAFMQTLWDRIVGAGSLTIESAGEHGQEVLVNVPHSDRVLQMLNHLIEEDDERRARLHYPAYPPPPYPSQGTPEQW